VVNLLAVLFSAVFIAVPPRSSSARPA